MEELNRLFDEVISDRAKEPSPYNEGFVMGVNFARANYGSKELACEVFREICEASDCNHCTVMDYCERLTNKFNTQVHGSEY